MTVASEQCHGEGRELRNVKSSLGRALKDRQGGTARASPASTRREPAAARSCLQKPTSTLLVCPFLLPRFSPLRTA